MESNQKYLLILILASMVLLYLYANGLYLYSNGIKDINLKLAEETYKPKNIFIDLGANKGDSVYNFFGLNEKALGGKLEKLVEKKLVLNRTWIIYAFEANPVFDKNLTDMKNKMISLGHEVHLFNSTAAFTYDGTIDFYLDLLNNRNDFWGSIFLISFFYITLFLWKKKLPNIGSSLNSKHPDVIKSNTFKVTVQCRDIAKIISKYRNEDLVVLKMDIEGAEYDMLFHFYKNNVLKLIDYAAIEYHPALASIKKISDVFSTILKLGGTKVADWA